MEIGKIRLKNNLLLAPMAGYSDVAFRHICRLCGAGLTTTEMVSAKALKYKSDKTEDLLISSPLEIPKSVQLFGHEPEVFAQVINYDCLKKFDIIDLNMGCPAPKIYKNGDGSALLKNLELSYKIIESCVKNSNKPITVKFRLGVDKEHIVGKEFAKMCEDAGASAITVHGRTIEQGYSGKANYEQIREIKDFVKIPLVANGDVWNVEDYNKIVSETNCDGVMIGRGSLGNPFIFCDILNSNYPFTKLDAIKMHYKMLLENYSEKFVVLNMRKHLSMYLKNESVANNIKQELLQLETAEDVLNIIEQIL